MSDDGDKSKGSVNVLKKYRVFYGTAAVSSLVLTVADLLGALKADHSWTVSPDTLMPTTDVVIQVVFLIVEVVPLRLFWIKKRTLDTNNKSTVTSAVSPSTERSGPSFLVVKSEKSQTV